MGRKAEFWLSKGGTEEGSERGGEGERGCHGVYEEDGGEEGGEDVSLLRGGGCPDVCICAGRVEEGVEVGAGGSGGEEGGDVEDKDLCSEAVEGRGGAGDVEGGRAGEREGEGVVG